MRHTGGNKPVFIKMQDDIRSDIATGELLPGGLIPSENSLAKKYKVCRTTVRKALDELTARGIILKRPGKGAFVKDLRSPEAIEKKQNKTIGFVINPVNLNPGGWYYAKLLEGMQSACSSKGIKLLLVADSELDSLDSSSLGGIVFMRNFEAVEKVKNSGVPILLINRFAEDENISYIAVDYREESRRGVEYLISQGHKKIGVVGAYMQSEVCRWRTNGYRDAMKKHGLPVEDDLILRIDDVSSDLYPLVKNYLMNVDATALFVVAASYVFSVGTALYELGNEKFNQFSILCFDDVENVINHPGPPISSILMPLIKMGEMAVEYLEEKIDDPKLPPLRELANAELVIRQLAAKEELAI